MNYALITGASSGIGYQLAKLFARDKYNLILVARREERLNQLARDMEENYQVRAYVIIKDLSLPQSGQEIHDWIMKNNIRIDLLVNNAGFAVYGSFADTRWEDEQKMMRLHMDMTTLMIKLFLPDMLRNNYGRILNVGSTGSFVPGPYISVYCASKSYILRLSEALSEELRGSGVKITVLCPGSTKTEFQSNAIRKKPSETETGGMKAEKVASIAYRALMRGKRVVIPGLQNKIQVFAIRFLPMAVVTRIIKVMMSIHK